MDRIPAEAARRLVEGLSYHDLTQTMVNLLWDVFGDVDEDGEDVLVPGRSPDKVDVSSLVTSLNQVFWPEQSPDGASAEDGGYPWCHPGEAAQAYVTDPDRVLNVLLLTDVDPTLAEIRAWTSEQRAEAFRWAATEHLAANDNPVDRLPEPEHVRALPRHTIGGRPRCLDDTTHSAPP